MRLALAAPLALLTILSSSLARAQQADTSSGASSEKSSFHPRVVTDVRFAVLVRSNDGYFNQAEVFGYPISREAVGIEGMLGLELVPRLTIGVGGGYYGSGATRRGAKLMLTSESLRLLVDFAALRYQSPDEQLRVSLDVVAGAGRYWIRETYTDPSLFSNTFVSDGAGLGGSGGVDLAFDIANARVVLGYAYHYAPATITNEIGGAVRAGGQSARCTTRAAIASRRGASRRAPPYTQALAFAPAKTRTSRSSSRSAPGTVGCAFRSTLARP
jgi:hypothetical protein